MSQIWFNTRKFGDETEKYEQVNRFWIESHYKDWSEAKITEEVQMIWVKYLKDNKEKLEKFKK